MDNKANINDEKYIRFLELQRLTIQRNLTEDEKNELFQIKEYLIKNYKLF